MGWITCVACLCSTMCLAAEPGQSATTTPPAPSAVAAAPVISGRERAEWFVQSTIGLRSLFGGTISAGWATAMNKPPEYESDWNGFAKRYGMRLSGVSVGNAIEAGIGTIWAEDPRYVRSGTGSFMGRVGHAAKLTVIARRGNGFAPAYARYAAIAGNNFLSNSWRVPSDDSTTDAMFRTVVGFSGRFVSNLVEEFWPDVLRLF